MPEPRDLTQALARAAEGKRVRFDRFMETVLYHPTLGYYARSADRTTRAGDFLTSPEVSPLFGECVAAWLGRVWRHMGGPASFHYVEVGAGRGELAASVLGAASGGLAEALHLHLVDRGAAAREALSQRFAGEPRVRVCGDVADLPEHLGAGAFVANELFDNLPVRRLLRADGWKEIVVRLEGSRLREALVEAPPALVEAARSQGIELADGQAAEVCEGAVPLLEAALSRLDTGGLLVLDYGGEASDVSGDAAPHGTLAAHKGHARSVDLYADLGQQDITAHVNFTPLSRAAERLGYAPTALEPQSRFLLEHGLAERLADRLSAARDDFERLRLTQLAKQLYHPEALGEAFRVLRGVRTRQGRGPERAPQRQAAPEAPPRPTAAA